MTGAVTVSIWLMLVLLTVGPVFSAEKHQEDAGWTWIFAALLLGPVAGLGYYMSRHAMRRVSGRDAAVGPVRHRA